MIALAVNLNAGALAAALDEDAEGLAAAARKVITRDVLPAAKQALRTHIRAAGLKKLANAVHSRVAAVTGATLDLEAHIYSKALVKRPGGVFDLIEVFAEGAVVTPVSGGHFLAIPTKAAGRGRRGAHAPSPADFPEGFFTLKISRGNRWGLLIPKDNPRAGAYFILVPSTRVPQRLDPEGAVAPVLVGVEERILTEWERHRVRQAA